MTAHRVILSKSEFKQAAASGALSTIMKRLVSSANKRTGLEDLLISGSAHGSLSVLKTWCWMVKPQIQSRCYLVSPKIGLGPVLFLIFTNDLPENIRSSVRLFADDFVLYRNMKSPFNCQILQACKMGDRLANET